jgi:hypothetical protein
MRILFVFLAIFFIIFPVSATNSDKENHYNHPKISLYVQNGQFWGYSRPDCDQAITCIYLDKLGYKSQENNFRGNLVASVFDVSEQPTKDDINDLYSTIQLMCQEAENQ